MKGVKFVEHIYKTDAVSLIVNDSVFCQFHSYRQNQKMRSESGGLLLGRTNINGTTRIFEITMPMENDVQDRITFIRKDKRHLAYVLEANNRCLYFKGNWHTHPQNVPSPSWIDKISWKNAMKNSKPGESGYIFFVIVGIEEVNIWCGNMKTFNLEKMKYQRERGDLYEV